MKDVQVKKIDPHKDAIDLLKSQFPAAQCALHISKDYLAGTFIEADGYDVKDMQSVIDALKIHSPSLILYRSESFVEGFFFSSICAWIGGAWLVFYCLPENAKGFTPRAMSDLMRERAKFQKIQAEAEDLDCEEDDDSDDEPDPMDAIPAAQMDAYIDACSMAPAMRFAKNFRERKSVCVKVLTGLGLNDEMADMVGANIESQSSQKWINEGLPAAAKELLSQGKTNKEIAAELGVTATKVKFLTS